MPKKRHVNSLFRDRMHKGTEPLGAIFCCSDEDNTFLAVSPDNVKRWKRKNPELC